MIIEDRSTEVIETVLSNEIGVDEIVGIASGHRLIHEAVLFNNIELVEFLIQNKGSVVNSEFDGKRLLGVHSPSKSCFSW